MAVADADLENKFPELYGKGLSSKTSIGCFDLMNDEPGEVPDVDLLTTRSLQRMNTRGGKVSVVFGHDDLLVSPCSNLMSMTRLNKSPSKFPDAKI